ncbi:MAG: hypothetical protein COU81_01270 [Candidatus Portnoybacteria bacterium CG10_big_fil_rev_8_21_14_0_10_36_7]|uniref:Uncharacterized protein n=1 Tax=Candidatus Portnoybacteria bacterium CG10_big_fil_rev_8_21_14_0_10_36_7 TaxID=1974812 RepID=A0A2M8KEK0_9BACT|nr:MAG: hypothetical protein COU81_01270 [Candidatus Portnoybacteria bacterium CG10_big_fil_rev_8_21_14_0_10_36_7]
MLENIQKKIQFLILICLSIVLLTISLLNNSVSYFVDLRQNSIKVKILENVIDISIASSLRDAVKINFYPQTRYSSNQYLISDKGFLNNLLKIYQNILLKTNPSQITYEQSPHSIQRYIQFNPFRSSFQISQGTSIYRFEINIPDFSLEVWKNNEKINQQIINVSWIKLIIFPILSSLSIAMLLILLFTSIFRPIGYHSEQK